MVKLMAKAEATIKDDPKAILERTEWQRIRVAASVEVLHPDHGVPFYSLHRAGRINNDQREAGDRYARLISDYRKLWRDPMGFMVDDGGKSSEEIDKLAQFGLGHAVADGMTPESEFETKRAKFIGKRYKEARFLAGKAARALEDLLIDGIWPVGERGHKEISDALTRLSHFFATGTKRKRR